MRGSTIDGATRVLELGRRIELEGGPQAALLFHGWTGWPGRLAHLADRLHGSGMTVVVPRLPGHGTNMADMLSTRAEDWLRRAVDEYLDLRDRYETVHVAGLSMGGILAAIVGARFDVPRVALLAPAFQARNRFLALAPLARWIVRRVPGSWDPEGESDPRARVIGSEYASWNYLNMAGELHRLQRVGTNALPDLRSDTLVVVSLADGSVPPSVADLVERRSNARRFKRVVVERSNHQLAEHRDRDAVVSAVDEWFTEPEIPSDS